MIQTSVAHLYHSVLPFAPKTPLWDMYRSRETLAEVQLLQGHETGWTSLLRTVSLPSGGLVVRYSHGGHMLAVGGRDFSELFLSRTGEPSAKLEFSCGRVDSISFSCDDRILATASGSTIRLWDIASGSLITTLLGDGANICCVDFHPYIDSLLVAGDADSRVYVWGVKDSPWIVFNVTGSTGRLCWVRQREQKRIIVRCDDERIEIWDVDTAQQVQLEVVSSYSSLGKIYAMASSDDGSLVASGSRDGMLAVYSSHTGEVIHSHKCSHWIYSVAFSPTAPALTFGSSQEVGLWFYTTGRIVTFTRRSFQVNSVAFSPNGRFVASTSPYHRTVHIWDTATTNSAPDDVHHSEQITSVHFSNDGQLIVSASSDKTVKVWDNLTGTLCTTLKGHALYVQDAIILPDKAHIVSIDYNDTLMVWNWPKGEALFTDTAIAREHGDFRTLYLYKHHLSPLGFISTHTETDGSEERTVCCWTIDLSVPSDVRIVLVARGVINTSKSDIKQITQRGSTETSNTTLTVECHSGKRFSTSWDGPGIAGNGSTQLQFVKELEELPLKGKDDSLSGSEAPCCQSQDESWILDEYDRQILWVPPRIEDTRPAGMTTTLLLEVILDVSLLLTFQMLF
jgi:WD40 repeat protein